MMEGPSNWLQLYSELKKNHDEAYFIIEKAIKLEEEGRRDDAFAKYESGLVLLDKALSIPIECPSNPDVTWEKACVMVQKMKKTRKEVLCRIADAQTSPRPVVAPPPSYEEAISSSHTPTASQSLVTYHDLAIALQDLKVETGAQTAEILYVQENVRIYFISPDGTVSAPSQPETLKIVQLEDESSNNPKAFLQVGNWIYPLIPGVSPCYRTEYNTFILPDVHSPVEGSTVGLILPEEADETVFELLEDILHGIVTRVPVPAPRAKRAAREGEYSYSIARGLVTGAQYISNGLIRGAEKAGEMLNYGTPKLIEKINPEPAPRQVNPSVSRGIEVAKNVTGTAVQITGYVASKIGTATMALGRYLAPHIQRQGSRLLTSTCNLTEQEASKKMDGVLEVAAGAVEGFGTVYLGLEKSAGILAKNLANNTVKVVEHKYGHAVGEATGNTLYTVGNVFVAGNNIRHLTPKGIAKGAAKSTGKAVVEDYRKSLQEEKDDYYKGPGPSKFE